MHVEMKVRTGGCERESGRQDFVWSTERRASRVRTCDEVNQGLVSRAATVQRCRRAGQLSFLKVKNLAKCKFGVSQDLAYTL